MVTRSGNKDKQDTLSMTQAEVTHQEGHQQHSLGIYLGVWILLFVLSSFSYAVDYFQLQGLLRWSLIILFMLLKAGLIIGIFMHMAWERLALISAILLPPLCLLVFIGLMATEADYTFLARLVAFGSAAEITAPHH